MFLRTSDEKNRPVKRMANLSEKICKEFGVTSLPETWRG